MLLDGGNRVSVSQIIYGGIVGSNNIRLLNFRNKKQQFVKSLCIAEFLFYFSVIATAIHLGEHSFHSHYYVIDGQIFFSLACELRIEVTLETGRYGFKHNDNLFRETWAN